MNYMQEYRLAYSEMITAAGEMGIVLNDDDDITMTLMRILTGMMKSNVYLNTQVMQHHSRAS